MHNNRSQLISRKSNSLRKPLSCHSLSVSWSLGLQVRPLGAWAMVDEHGWWARLVSTGGELFVEPSSNHRRTIEGPNAGNRFIFPISCSHYKSPFLWAIIGKTPGSFYYKGWKEIKGWLHPFLKRLNKVQCLKKTMIQSGPVLKSFPGSPSVE